MNAGDKTCAAGTMSGAIHGAMIDPTNGIDMGLYLPPGNTLLANDTALKAMCAAIAQGVVSHITGFAVITVIGPDPQGGAVTSIGNPPTGIV